MAMLSMHLGLPALPQHTHTHTPWYLPTLAPVSTHRGSWLRKWHLRPRAAPPYRCRLSHQTPLVCRADCGPATATSCEEWNCWGLPSNAQLAQTCKDSSELDTSLLDHALLRSLVSTFRHLLIVPGKLDKKTLPWRSNSQPQLLGTRMATYFPVSCTRTLQRPACTWGSSRRRSGQLG